MPVFFFNRGSKDKNIFKFNRFHRTILLFFDIFHTIYAPNFMLGLFFKHCQCYTFSCGYYRLFKQFFEEFVFPVAQITLLLEGGSTIMLTPIVLFIFLEFHTNTFNSYCLVAGYRLCFISNIQYAFRLKKKRRTLYRRKRSIITIPVKNKF